MRVDFCICFCLFVVCFCIFCVVVVVFGVFLCLFFGGFFCCCFCCCLVWVFYCSSLWLILFKTCLGLIVHGFLV